MICHTPTGKRFAGELAKLRHDITDLEQRIAEWGSALQSDEEQELLEARKLHESLRRMYGS